MRADFSAEPWGKGTSWLSSYPGSPEQPWLKIQCGGKAGESVVATRPRGATPSLDYQFQAYDYTHLRHQGCAAPSGGGGGGGGGGVEPSGSSEQGPRRRPAHVFGQGAKLVLMKLTRRVVTRTLVLVNQNGHTRVCVCTQDLVLPLDDDNIYTRSES